MDIKNIDKEKLSAFYGGAHEYLVMLNLYDSAVRLLKLKFEVLNNEFKVLYERNPIHHIDSRLKSPESMIADVPSYIAFATSVISALVGRGFVIIDSSI